MHFMKLILTNRNYSLTKKVMESNVLKQKSLHIQPSHFQNNKTASTPLTMGTEARARVKNHSNGDKENLNPNRKTQKTLGGVDNSEVRTMINQNKFNSHEATHRQLDRRSSVDASEKEESLVAEAQKKLHVYEKSNTSANTASQNQHNSVNTRNPIPHSYIEAIKQLNTLQSNVKALKESRIKRGPAETKAVQVDQVLHYLGHLNVTADDIRQLHFIHISGTKGKGSTSAYCESILRSHGFTTGFFSSPHLIEVRERIKLNGQPVSYELFTKYFWTVYNALHAKRSHPEDMPAYFKFLTVMSFYMFVKEKPDVCIMEVGIGGLYDNTNIIPNTDVVGISSLGFDHTAVLGNTMEEIAAQKAGIMKPSCLAVTAARQKDICKRVLLDKSNDLNCVLLEAPNILQYNWKGQPVDEDWKSTVQSINISLAIQLAYLWMFRMNKSGELKAVIEKFLAGISSHRHSQQRKLPEKDVDRPNTSLPLGLHFEIDPQTYRGIRDCVWPGRLQVIKKNNLKYFLDGAHTVDSIALCSQWFRRKSAEEASVPERNRLETFTQLKDSDCLKQPAGFESSPLKEAIPDRSVRRILVFNVTGDRDPAVLLPPLIQSNRFDFILVTPNLLTNESSPDIQYGGNRTCDRYGKKWNAENSLRDRDSAQRADPSGGADSIRPGPTVPYGVDSCNNTLSHADKLIGVRKIVSVASSLSCHAQTKVIAFDNVLDTYNFKRRLDPTKEYHVLVTGSLHLVGAFLNVLTNYE